MYIPHFLYPIICQQTFGLFPHLAIVNSAAMKMEGLISLQDPDFNSLDIYWEVGLLNNKEVLFLTFFWAAFLLLSMEAIPFCIPTNSAQGSYVYTSMLTLVFVVFIFKVILTSMRWYLLVVFIWISLMISDKEHLFSTYLLVICVSSLKMYLFKASFCFKRLGY